jgi:hypothetical protein
VLCEIDELREVSFDMHERRLAHRTIMTSRVAAAIGRHGRGTGCVSFEAQVIEFM